MRKVAKLFSVLTACIFILPAAAQEKLPDFGNVDIADMQLRECPFEKNADAMNLLSYESAHIYSTVSGVFIDIEKRVRIKIFNQRGFKFATVAIPYFGQSDDKIKSISAITYNLNGQGKIVKQVLEKNDIFRVTERGDGNSVRFAFPGVKAGSIIELQYFEKSDFQLNLTPWLFDDYIPTRKSVCTIGYNEILFPNIRVTATMPVEKYRDSSYGNVNETYAMANIPAFTYEPLMGAVKDNVQRIEVSILPQEVARNNDAVETKWPDVISFLLNSPYFGAQLKKDVGGVKPFIDSVKKLPLYEKITAVCRHTINTAKWNGEYSFFADNIDAAWSKRRGNSGEINLIAITLLRRAGVECYPIITGTTNSGKVDMGFLSLGQFNCVDILIADGNTWHVVDAAQKLPFTIPPANVFNNYGLVIDKKHGMWFKIKDNRVLLSSSINLKAAIDSNGKLTGNLSEYFYGYAKTNTLSAPGKVNNDESRDFLGQDIINIKIDSSKEENTDDDQKALMRSFVFKADMQQTGNYYFLNPLSLSSFRKNPFTDTARRFDIDFGCNQAYSVVMSISFPDNFEVTELPANKEIRLPDTSISFRRIIAVENNTVIVRSDFELQNAAYGAQQYPFIKQVFEKIYALLNEQLVFKKK